MKSLVFAEKPSVGRDIARILGAVQKNNGYYEGGEWIVTWGIGHLISLSEPGEQNQVWKKWSLQTLPMIPQEWKLSVLERTAPQFYIVKRLMTREDVKMIVNAADAGREGELIFRLVYRMSQSAVPVKRLWISSMTDEAIQHGFSRLKPLAQYDSLGAAAESRMRADWLVGLNFTRCYTKKSGAMLTLGRVQTPTLAMVVNRQQEIDNFVPVPFWEVEIFFPTFRAVWFSEKNKEHPSRISTNQEAEKILAEIQGKTAEVQSVHAAKKRAAPPLLYDLTTLQREANAKYSLTAAQTLKAAQTLYEEKKAVTYPRTDSRYLSNDLYSTIPSRLQGIPGVYEKFRNMLPKKIPQTKKVFDDKKVSDHHAIIPTERKLRDFAGWKKEEQWVYDLIVRRFLAVFFPDYEFLATTLILKIAKHLFRATGQVVINPGWKEVYEKDQPDVGKSEDDGQVIPDVKKGDVLTLSGSEAKKKETRPPPFYTEASLLQAMETAGRFIDDEDARQALKDCGLGTPATRAEIIEKLIRVEYMFRDKKRLVPTVKGRTLISFVDPRLKSPELTGQWEKRLSELSQGIGDSVSFLSDIEKFVAELVETIKLSRLPRLEESKPASESNSPKVVKPAGESKAPRVASKPSLPSSPGTSFGRPHLGLCPACGKGKIIEGERGFGCDRFRQGCSYVVWKEFMGKKLPKAAVCALIAGKSSRLLQGFIGPSGEKLSGRLAMAEDRKGITFFPKKAEERK